MDPEKKAHHIFVHLVGIWEAPLHPPARMDAQRPPPDTAVTLLGKIALVLLQFL